MSIPVRTELSGLPVKGASQINTSTINATNADIVINNTTANPSAVLEQAPAGSTVYFDEGTYTGEYFIYSEGVQVSAHEESIFDGQNEYQTGFTFGDQATGSSLSDVNIKNYNEQGVMTYLTDDFTISNTEISNIGDEADLFNGASRDTGIQVYGGQGGTIDNVTIDNTESQGIAINDGTDHTITDSVVNNVNNDLNFAPSFSSGHVKVFNSTNTQINNVEVGQHLPVPEVSALNPNHLDSQQSYIWSDRSDGTSVDNVTVTGNINPDASVVYGEISSNMKINNIRAEDPAEAANIKTRLTSSTAATATFENADGLPATSTVPPETRVAGDSGTTTTTDGTVDIVTDYIPDTPEPMNDYAEENSNDITRITTAELMENMETPQLAATVPNDDDTNNANESTVTDRLREMAQRNDWTPTSETKSLNTENSESAAAATETPAPETTEATDTTAPETAAPETAEATDTTSPEASAPEGEEPAATPPANETASANPRA